MKVIWLILCVAILLTLPPAAQAAPAAGAYDCVKVYGHHGIVTRFSAGFPAPNVLEVQVLGLNLRGRAWTYKTFFPGQQVFVDYKRCVNDNGSTVIYVKKVR